MDSSVVMVLDDFNNDFTITDCVLHNPNLITFVSNMQRQKVIICGCLPSGLFSISRAVGGPVFLVQAHVFIFLSSHRRESFVT